MNTFYFSYLFHKYKIFYLLLLGLFILIYPVLCLFITNSNSNILEKISYFPTVVIMVLGYLLPLASFVSYYKRDKSYLLYSLPESRTTIFRTNAIFHLTFVIVSFLISGLLNMLIFYLRNINIDFLAMFQYIVFMIIVFVAAYSFSSFCFSISRNYFDVIVISLGYLALPVLFLIANYVVFRNELEFLKWEKISLLGIADNINRFFSTKMISSVNQIYPNYNIITTLPFLSCFFMYLTHMELKSLEPENIGSTTKSVFGYHTLILLYSFVFLVIANFQTGITFFIVMVTLLIAFVLANFILYRRFKVSKLLIIEFILLVGISNLLVYLLGGI